VSLGWAGVEGLWSGDGDAFAGFGVGFVAGDAEVMIFSDTNYVGGCSSLSSLMGFRRRIRGGCKHCVCF